MTRIEKKFRQLKKQGRSAFIAFLTCGYPDLNTTFRLVLELDRSGVDIIELGVPFSDPLADGPVIQSASEYSLKKGIKLKDALRLVSRIRKKSQVPIAIMSYFNPILSMGLGQFAKFAAGAGVDGLIVPDLPPEEAHDLMGYAKEYKLNTIFFLSPTSPKERIRLAARVSSGFIYYVSLTGVTGARDRLQKDLQSKVKFIKRLTNKPICVGFGVSDRNQVRAVSKIADGVIVGSAIISKIKSRIGKKDLVGSVGRFVRNLSGKLI